ncbi:hypothetical protein [Sporosarcina sp. 6E9]|nr:hypothetical protein [Sporosarcina sp. 6E9]
MKKILAFLFILTILGSSFLGNNASAHYDEMPKLTSTPNVSIYDVNPLD